MPNRRFDRNIEPGDAWRQSCAPFVAGTDMRIGSVSLPAGLVRSIRIMCTEGVFLPVRIGRVSYSFSNRIGGLCRLYFLDAYGNPVGYVKMCRNSDSDWITAPILDNDDCLCGHMAYSKELPPLVFSAVEGDAMTDVACNLTLLPQCHVPWLDGKVKSIAINGSQYHGDVKLEPGPFVHVEKLGDVLGKARFGVVGKYAAKEPQGDAGNRLCWLDVVTLDNDGTLTHVTPHPVWIGGKHLILRHSDVSNVRVTGSGTGTGIKGVMDG